MHPRRGIRTLRIKMTTICLLGFLAGPALASDWPGFRGPDGCGTHVGKTLLSTADSVGLKVAWKMPLGSGYSGVAISGSHVVTMFSDEKHDHAIAFDRETGKQLWKFKLGSTYKGHDGSHTGPISTPLIAGDRAYCLTAQGKFHAIDLKTGSEQWSTDLVADHGAKKPHYGFTASPVYAGGAVVLPFGAENAAVTGFHPDNGKKLWSVGADGVQYQSPIVYPQEGSDATVLAGCDKNIYCVNAKDGKIAWEFPHGGGGPYGAGSLSPVPIGKDRLFLTAGDEACSLVNLKREGGKVSHEQAWESRGIRKSYNVPVYHDGHIYGFSNRIMTCLSADTGDIVWRSRDPGDGFLTMVDGHLITLTKKGSLHVAKASSEGYNDISSLKVFKDLAWTNPGFAGNSFYLRSLTEIARVDIIAGPQRTDSAIASVEELPPGSAFAQFIKEVETADFKRKVIDDYLSGQTTFPIIEEGIVHFVYRGEGDDLAVAGDLFGARQERAMTRIKGTDFFYRSARVESDARLNYLFMKDYEAIVDPRNPRKDTITVLGKDMDLSFGMAEPLDVSWFAMPSWKEPSYLSRIETHELESKSLGVKHEIDVYLPPGYDDSKDRMPVAYIHGGAAAVEHGGFRRVLDNLVGRRIEPIIVVFIKYTPNFFGPGGMAYPALYAKEVVPFVDKTYRTIAKKEARASIGQGFAGFTSIMCVLSQKDVASKMGCQSAFIFGSMANMLPAMISSPDSQPLTIYMDWGKYDLRNPHENWDLAQANRDFAKLIKEKGYTFVGGEVNDGTDWPSWRNRYGEMFIALFPKK